MAELVTIPPPPVDPATASAVYAEGRRLIEAARDAQEARSVLAEQEDLRDALGELGSAILDAAEPYDELLAKRDEAAALLAEAQAAGALDGGAGA